LHFNVPEAGEGLDHLAFVVKDLDAASRRRRKRAIEWS